MSARMRPTGPWAARRWARGPERPDLRLARALHREAVHTTGVPVRSLALLLLLSALVLASCGPDAAEPSPTPLAGADSAASVEAAATGLPRIVVNKAPT